MTMSVFFFSSRRRHTRYIGDWSSDVCSSDLYREGELSMALDPDQDEEQARAAAEVAARLQIGRASCRERWRRRRAEEKGKEARKQRRDDEGTIKYRTAK